MPYSIDQVANAIRTNWDKDTSASPDEWSADNHALGQCVPSSLVAQDLLGGMLERLTTARNGKRETHYRNQLADGQTVDISGDQYPEDQAFEPAPVEGDVREYVLGNENTRRRYRLLLGRVTHTLAQMQS